LKIAKSTGKRSQEIKEVTIVKLLQAASPLEAKYIVRWLQGNLRTGVAEKTAIAALARAVTRSPDGKCDKKALLGDEAFDVLEGKVEGLIREAVCQFPNPGGIIETLLEIGEDYEKLKERCHIEVGIPVRPMLAKPTKEISEIFKRFDGQKFTCEYKYDGFRG
jgi:DNA ligase 1